MRTQIFTDAERQAIKTHLSGEPVAPNFWAVLVHRIKRNNLGLLEDVDLMKKVLTSVQKVDDQEEKEK